MGRGTGEKEGMETSDWTLEQTVLTPREADKRTDIHTHTLSRGASAVLLSQ